MYKNRNIQKSLIQIYANVLKNDFPPNILIQAKYDYSKSTSSIRFPMGNIKHCMIPTL